MIDPANVQASQFALVGTGNASFSKFTPKVGVDFRPDDDTMLYASVVARLSFGWFQPARGNGRNGQHAVRPETVDSYEIGGKVQIR